MGGAHAHDDSRAAGKKAAGAGLKNSGSGGFLNRAGRTFSFGVQKKNSVPPPQDDSPAEVVPPVPTIQYEDDYGRSRGMTASTASTATPPKLEGGNGMDMGGDFGSMFTGFDKRASTSTLKNLGSPTPRAGSRPGQPVPLSLDNSSSVDPSPQSWNSHGSNEELLGPNASSPGYDRPPPVPRHQSPPEFLASNRPTDISEDSDARLFQDSLLAGRFLAGSNNYPNTQSGGRREEDSFRAVARKPIASTFSKSEDNMFDGSMSRFSRPGNRQSPQASASGQNKVMTTAQFERYRQDKERQDRLDRANKTQHEEEDEDEVNYDEEEEEDDAERAKQQAKQRRKQQAHMAVYRQQMMKVTGESAMVTPAGRPNLQTSMSAPQITHTKAPSPDPTGGADEEDDDEVPLAILQAHGFPNKNRHPSRLSTMGSNPNLRASVIAPAQTARPGSSMGEPSSGGQRHSTLPAFARGLPQDPFVGAGISKPALRESLSYSGGSQINYSSGNQSPGGLPPGGLVGVIANEERSRAMRRGSPNMDQKLMGQQGGGYDPAAGIPHQMMYNGGRASMMPGMNGMPQMTAGDQAQIQMTQQMQQFMEMQMQFMQMMASGQGAGGAQMPQPYGGGIPGSQSMADLSSRQSMLGDFTGQPRPLDPGARTMSMVQPPGMQFLPQSGFAPSIRVAAPGYTPSIAPSERSNVGLPGRYRPVSQASNHPQGVHQRSNTMSGALSTWDEPSGKSTVRVVSRAADGSDDDDEEGWEAMKAARDQKMAQRKSKKHDFLGGF